MAFVAFDMRNDGLMPTTWTIRGKLQRTQRSEAVLSPTGGIWSEKESNSVARSNASNRYNERRARNTKKLLRYRKQRSEQDEGRSLVERY